MTLVSSSGCCSSIGARCRRANSAARWPPWPSKTAKQELKVLPLKFSLVMNWTDTQLLVRLNSHKAWKAEILGKTKLFCTSIKGLIDGNSLILWRKVADKLFATEWNGLKFPKRHYFSKTHFAWLNLSLQQRTLWTFLFFCSWQS